MTNPGPVGRRSRGDIGREAVWTRLRLGRRLVLESVARLRLGRVVTDGLVPGVRVLVPGDMGGALDMEPVAFGLALLLGPSLPAGVG